MSKNQGQGPTPSGNGGAFHISADTVQGLQQGNDNLQVIVVPGRAPRQVPRRYLFRLPRKTKSFTARGKQLAALERGWPAMSETVAPPLQVVTGLPGVGKTQLAAAYVEAHTAQYDLVAWVHAVDPVTDLADLAAKLNLIAPDDTLEERAEWAVLALAAWETPWLLVFDNVEDPEMLRRWCPAAGPGRVVVTTRDRRLAPEFGSELKLAVFERDDAASFLLTRTKRPQTEHEAAEAVAEALGRLPLALAHAGAYCAVEDGTSFGDYLQLLDQLPAGELFDASPEAFYTETVASTWAVSIAAAARRTPLAADVLNMAAVLDPDAIPLQLFDQLLGHGETVGRAAARHRLHQAVQELSAFSLVTVNETELSVHRLLQKVVRDQLHATANTDPLVRAVDSLTAALPDDLVSPASWPAYQRLVAHVQAVANHPHQQLTAATDALPALLNQTVSHLLRAGDMTALTALASRATDVADTLLGPAHPETFTSRSNLTFSYWSAGQAGEAIALGEQVLADAERLLGSEHPDTLAARANLATSYRWAGRTGEAIALHEQTVADAERLLGSEHPDTLTARANLATSYRWAGRAGEAIPLHEQAVADHERLLGPEHPDTLTARANLASSYWSAGRTGEAIPLQEQVLAARERLLGLEHPDTLTARANLASTYGTAGRTAEAIPLEEQVLAARERLLGPEHPETLVSRGNLASSYGSAGRTAEAIPLQELVLADFERLLGREHPDTLTARGNLAFSYGSAGRTAETIPLEEQVLAARERLLGPKHPDTLVSRENLAAYYRLAGRTGDAIALQASVLSDREPLLRPEHPYARVLRRALEDRRGRP